MELNFNLAVFEVENKDSMKQIRAEVLEIVEFSGEGATQLCSMHFHSVLLRYFQRTGFNLKWRQL